jgi:nucleoside-diphosphate-sugar epimerase
VDRGWSVVGVDAFTDYYPRALKLGNLERLMDEPAFELHELDLSADPVDELLDGVEVVFHLAAQAGVRGSFGRTFDVYVRHNVIATQRVLEAAVRRPGIRCVYASSSSVYGNADCVPTPEDAPRRPVSPYGMTKVATEELAGVYSRSYGIPNTGLRYFTAYGPRQRPDMAFSRFIEAALSGDPITILGDGMQLRDFTYVEDVVESTIAAARSVHEGARVFNIGGGSPVSLMTAIHTLETVVGHPIHVRHVQRQVGDALHTSADVRLAQAVLGYRPTTDLESGLQAQFEWALGAARSHLIELAA